MQSDRSIRWVRLRSFPSQNQFEETWGLVGLKEDSLMVKRDEEILNQREQEFRALVERSPDIIFRLDRQLRHLYVNPAVELATGITNQEFLGKTHRELGMPEAIVSTWEQLLEKIFQMAQEDELEFSFNTPNGLKYYQSRIVPELAADGSVESVLGICRDITKTKRMEEALRENEELFRTVFETAPIGIALINLNGMLLKTNQAFQEILGYSLEELQNRLFTEFTHPVIQAEDFKLLQELLLEKRTQVIPEKPYLRKDGRLIWVNVSLTAVYDTNGLPSYTIAMIQDISEQKKAHDELEKRVTERTAELGQANTLLKQEIAERQQVQKELKAQKDFLQAVIDTNPNVIFVKDSFGRYVLANQVFADFHGITIEDMIGLTDSQLNINQADAERFIAQDIEVFTTLRQKFIPEEDCHTSTGEVRWFQTIKKPLFSSAGQICQVLGVSTDITKRKQTERQLEESLREKEVLLQEIHHRVKNNLQVIHSLLDLQSEYSEEPSTQSVLRDCCHRVKAMAFVHEHLYQIKNYTSIKAPDYIKSLTDHLFQTYAANPSKLNLELDIEKVAFNISTALTCGLIINELVSNAMKYAFPKDTKGTIKVTLHSEVEPQFILIVKDNGVGFPSNWDFNKVETLGLQLVNVLVNQLEGTLELDQNTGTEFRVRFSD